MPVTIKDIAKKAGVSTTTVSFALRGRKPGKRPLAHKTVSHVCEVARKLGYRPNHIAASLVGQKTHTIGVLLRSLSFGSEDLIEGIKSKTAPEYSSMLSVYNSDGENERDKLDMFVRQRVDGIIAAFSGDPESIPMYREISEQLGIPLVLIDRGIDGLDLPVVRSDHFASTYEGTRALQRLGHKRIRYASVSAACNLESTRLRLDGYKQAMIDSGLEDEIVVTNEQGHKEWINSSNLRQVACGILDSWMTDAEKSTAMFVDNDWLAYEIMDECKNCGIRVPEDLSLMGIGDYEFSSFGYVSLSSVVSQKQKPMGIKAGEMLLNLMDENTLDEETVVLPIEVKLRNTTRSINGTGH
jgi:LacI family transcriptional regulator